MVGQFRSVIVVPGDTLHKIARRFEMNVDVLAAINQEAVQSLLPGRRIILPTLHILPIHRADGIYLNIPEREVYLFRDGRLVAAYPVAVGRFSWQTRTGSFALANRVVNPQWKPTREMVARTSIQDDIVPPGEENPVGDRWMGWSAPGYGFHSTTAPSTIGRAASHGCVRLYPESAQKMFELVRKGDPIVSYYEPILVGYRGGRYYLAAFEDIYKRGLTTPEHAEALLRREGIWSRVDPEEVAEIVQSHIGYPVSLHLRDSTK